MRSNKSWQPKWPLAVVFCPVEWRNIAARSWSNVPGPDLIPRQNIRHKMQDEKKKSEFTPYSWIISSNYCPGPWPWQRIDAWCNTEGNVSLGRVQDWWNFVRFIIYLSERRYYLLPLRAAPSSSGRGNSRPPLQDLGIQTVQLNNQCRS